MIQQNYEVNDNSVKTIYQVGVVNYSQKQPYFHTRLVLQSDDPLKEIKGKDKVRGYSILFAPGCTAYLLLYDVLKAI